MNWWFGVSKRIGKHLWLNPNGKGNPSVTCSLGKGASVNFKPKYGLSFRVRRRLGKRWW